MTQDTFSGAYAEGDLGLRPAEMRALELERCWALIAAGSVDINGPSAPPGYREAIDIIIAKPAADAFAPIITNRLREQRGASVAHSWKPWVVHGGMTAAVLSGASVYVPRMIEQLSAVAPTL